MEALLRLEAEEILVTEQLFSRAARAPDLKAEAEAFKRLGEALVLEPEAAVQLFVDLALELCPNAGSSGLSELEQTPETTQFRWTALAGVFAPHVGGVTLRDDSPCGLCLDAHHAILVDRPARRFHYFEAAGTPIVEGLVVPLYDSRKIPLGTIWIVSHEPGRGFDATDVRVVEQLAILLVLALKLRSENPGPSAERLKASLADDASRLLLRIALYRDKDAFAVLFAQYAGRLKGYLIRCGFRDIEAEDCVQDALLSVWRKADQFDPCRATAAAWIFTIARNRMLDVRRRGPRFDELLLDDGEPFPTPEQFLEDVEGATRLRAALKELPAAQADLLSRSYFEEETHLEIARQLHLPVGTVKSRIRLGMGRLKAMLSPSSSP